MYLLGQLTDALHATSHTLHKLRLGQLDPWQQSAQQGTAPPLVVSLLCQTQNWNFSDDCCFSEVILIATLWCFSAITYCSKINVILRKSFGEKNGSQILHCFINCILFSGPAFDPLGQARGPAPPLEEKNEDAWVVFLFKYLRCAHVLHKKQFPLISLGKPPPKLQNCT